MIEVTVKKTFTENQRNAEKCFDALRNIEGASQSDDILIGCSKSTRIVVYFKGDERQMLSKIRRVLLKYKDSPKTAPRGRRNEMKITTTEGQAGSTRAQQGNSNVCGENAAMKKLLLQMKKYDTLIYANVECEEAETFFANIDGILKPEPPCKGQEEV